MEVAVQRTQRRRKAHERRIKAAFAALPTEEMPADMAGRIESELDAILADLRAGKLDTVVTFTDADHDAMEGERLGAYLVGHAA